MKKQGEKINMINKDKVLGFMLFFAALFVGILASINFGLKIGLWGYLCGACVGFSSMLILYNIVRVLGAKLINRISRGQ